MSVLHHRLIHRANNRLLPVEVHEPYWHTIGNPSRNEEHSRRYGHTMCEMNYPDEDFVSERCIAPRYVCDPARRRRRRQHDWRFGFVVVATVKITIVVIDLGDVGRRGSVGRWRRGVRCTGMSAFVRMHHRCFGFRMICKVKVTMGWGSYLRQLDPYVGEQWNAQAVE